VTSPYDAKSRFNGRDALQQRTGQLVSAGHAKINFDTIFQNITVTLGYGEDMMLRLRIKGAAMMELRQCSAGNVDRKRVRGDLLN
jgi:hypothetical protein